MSQIAPVDVSIPIEGLDTVSSLIYIMNVIYGNLMLAVGTSDDYYPVIICTSRVFLDMKGRLNIGKIYLFEFIDHRS